MRSPTHLPDDESAPLLQGPAETARSKLSRILSAPKNTVWGSSSLERSLLIKLDFSVLVYFSIIWFLFGVNRASYSTAYISGMRDDLHFHGKDYNYMNTIYLIAYAICQIPSTSLLTVVKPRYVFVAANTAWSVLTLLTFRVNHVWQVFVLNGFEGAFSAVAYMAGGWIQAALLKSVSGNSSSLEAWRLIFVVVSCATIPFAVFEKELAITRLGKIEKKDWDSTVIARVLLSWQFYLLPLVFMRTSDLATLPEKAPIDPRPLCLVYSLVVQALGNNVMPLWLASRGYSLAQQNTLPTFTHAAGILATFLYCSISDRLRSRWQASLCIGLTFILCSAILAAGPSAAAWYFFAFYLLGTTYAPQALWYSWMADVTSHDVQLRALTTGFMNSFDFAFVTWWPLVFFPVTDAPDFRRGYLAGLGAGLASVPVIGVIAVLERRGRAKGLLGREDSVVGRESGPEDQDLPGPHSPVEAQDLVDVPFSSGIMAVPMAK
nr:pantothenate transporter liz1 [Quercus suber]